MGARAKVQPYALGAEHGPGLLLADALFLIGSAAVENACKVHVEDRVGQVGNQLPISGFGVAVVP